MDKREFMERLMVKFNNSVDKLALIDSEPLKRYLTEEYLELITDTLIDSKLYDVDVKLYTSFSLFEQGELRYTNCLTGGRTVERKVLATDNIIEDESGTEISVGVTKHMLTGEPDEVNIIIYSSVDSMVFNFYEEILAMYIPSKLLKELETKVEPFMRIVR